MRSRKISGKIQKQSYRFRPGNNPIIGNPAHIFFINLLMGLTRMRLFTFFWVSQLGLLAGTVVYVNAGKELAKIESLSGIKINIDSCNRKSGRIFS
jgi:hypothetical protein